VKILTLGQLRFLRFAPWSTLTVLIGVTLGVSSIVAVHQISERVVVSMERLTPGYLRSVTHLLDRPDLSMPAYFDLRARWRAGGIEGLQGMLPLVEGTALLEGRPFRVLGLDALSGLTETLPLAGLPPMQVVVGVDAGYQAGDEIRVSDRAHRVAGSVEGLTGDLIITDPGTAQSLLGLDSQVLTRIAVVVQTPATRLMEWSDRFMPGLSAGFELADWTLEGWRVRTMESDLPDLVFARSVLFNLGALGSLALVVAWLLVYQVGIMWLRRRQQTFERLRQMGVSEAELRSGFLLGLTGLGLVSSLAGLWLGDLLAGGLTRMVTGYGEIGAAGDGLDYWLVLKALGSAAGVCLLGGWIAFEREARQRVAGSRARLVVALVVLAGIAGVLVDDSLLGGFVGIAAVALFTLWIIAPLLRGLARGSRHLRGRLLRVAGLRELVWYPDDLAVAVGALTLALATSLAMALMVDSFRSDFEAMLDRRMLHDLFVDGEGRDLAETAAWIQSRPEVSAVQRYGRSEVSIAGERVLLGFTRFDGAEAARYGLARPLAAGECLVNERLARTLSLAEGGSLRILDRDFTVAGIFPGFGDRGPRLLVGLTAARSLGVPIRFDRLSVSSSAPAQTLAALAGLNPLLEVVEREAMRTSALSIFDRTFAITRALTLLALLVAGVGLYNALLALQLQQQRTRQLLQALGVTRSELAGLARWRALGVGAAAVAFALPLGLIMGGLLCRVINPRAFGWSLNLLVTWESILWPILSAVVAIVVVLLIPKPSESLLDEG
jgi:putative ABC transport system permease protein